MLGWLLLLLTITTNAKLVEAIDERVHEETCADGVSPGDACCASGFCGEMCGDRDEVVQDIWDEWLLRKCCAPNFRCLGCVVEFGCDGWMGGKIVEVWEDIVRGRKNGGKFV